VGVKVQYIHRAMVGANCPQDGVYNGVVPAEDQRPAMVVEYRGDCFFNGHETASSPIGHEIARILETRVAIKADAQQSEQMPNNATPASGLTAPLSFFI
jgi:hypothetical protein